MQQDMLRTVVHFPRLVTLAQAPGKGVVDLTEDQAQMLG
jgi:hypothetical protein